MGATREIPPTRLRTIARDRVRRLDLTKPRVLSGTSGARTLTIGQAGLIDVRQKCIEIAGNAWRDGAEVVVFGHTHLPQQYPEAAPLQ